MGVDVTIYNKNKIKNENGIYDYQKYEEVDYIGGRFEPFHTISSVILHTKKMQSDHNCTDNNCDNVYKCFSKYGLNEEIIYIIGQLLEDGMGGVCRKIETPNYIIDIG